jgi:hypothetical protein
MKRNWLVLLVAVVLVTLVVAACAPAATPAPTSVPSTATTVPTAAPKVAPTVAPTSAPSKVAGAPQVPASHAGRTACLTCHATGANGAPKFPTANPDHTSFKDDNNAALCFGCHVLAK